MAGWVAFSAVTVNMVDRQAFLRWWFATQMWICRAGFYWVLIGLKPAKNHWPRPSGWQKRVRSSFNCCFWRKQEMLISKNKRNKSKHHDEVPFANFTTSTFSVCCLFDAAENDSDSEIFMLCGTESKTNLREKKKDPLRWLPETPCCQDEFHLIHS